MIEIEKRSLLNKKDYFRLQEYFQKNAKFLEKFKRFTLIKINNSDYTPDTKSETDLRIRTQGEHAKFTLKSGNWHNGESRSEYEIHFKTEEIADAIGIMISLGGEYFVAVYIERQKYELGRYSVTLDKYIFNDDYILEIELSDEIESDNVKKEEDLIEVLMKELDVEVLQSEEMIKFIKKLNFIKKAQVRLTPDKVEKWCVEWDGYINCVV